LVVVSLLGNLFNQRGVVSISRRLPAVFRFEVQFRGFYYSYIARVPPETAAWMMLPRPHQCFARI
jgi:hypothetical protein